MTDKVKNGIKKAAEVIMYLVIGALISAGILNADKIKEVVSKSEAKQVETAADAYAEQLIDSKTVVVLEEK